MEATGETDSPAEEDGFEPSVPLGKRGPRIDDTPEEREQMHGRLGPLDDDIPF